MRTQLEVARADPNRDVDALLDRLEAANTRAIELTEALLLLARADGQAFERQRVDLSLLAEEAVETLLPMAESRGIEIESAADSAFVVGSPSLLLQLITNLMHNAIVHNVSACGRIWPRVSTAHGAPTVTIANTGGLLSDAVIGTLVEPFQRGAGRVRRAETDAGDQRGLGLGLAIAQSIVRAHDGGMRLDARPDGGLVVQVRLPRHPD